MHVTVVSPSGKVLPLAGLQLTETEPELSVAVGVSYVTAAPEPLVASATLSAGVLVNVGGVESLNVTLTVNDAVAVFPCESVAEQVTVVSPTGKVDPDAGLHVAGTVPSTVSVADGVV